MAYSNIRKVVPLHTKKKAALYVRVSTRYQIDKDSLPFQRKKLKEYCKVLGIDDFVIFEDDGYSGKNTERPHFQEMMSCVRVGEISHIIVWKVDRISRNLLDFAAMYQELKENRVTFISMNEQFDTSSAIGEAMLKIILIFAELERRMVSERVTSIMLNRAEQGLWNGARMPVGYRWNEETKFPEPDPEETKIVQFIFDEYEKVKSCLKVARYLNSNHIPSKRGGEWTSKLIHDIIRNPFYIGTYRYNMREAGRGPLKPENEWIIRENNHSPIIDKEQFARCNQIMDANGTSRNTSEFRTRKYIHTFSGHLVCGKCGFSMVASKDSARANGWKPSIYRCSKRSRVSDCDNSKTLNESYIGSFVFNYVANLARVQKNFKNIKTLDELQTELLQGPEFESVHAIASDGLEKTFTVLAFKTIGKGSYLPNMGFPMDNKKQGISEQIMLLKGEIEKLKNAITRLTDVYLYDLHSMTKEEFTNKKKELVKKVSELEEQLSNIYDNSNKDKLTDLSFIKKASAFLIAQHINSKDHVDYVSMAIKIDNELLRDFIEQIIDKIVVNDGRIESIQFINGLKHEFIYNRPAELIKCQCCGGRIGATVGCRTRTFRFENKTYHRIKVGDALDDSINNHNMVCSGCYAHKGRWHHWKCEKERCPICGKYLITCEHGTKKS